MAIPSVGDDIEAVCGRCGQSWHVVMAKVGERIAKVVCKRCGAHHGYRGPEEKEDELSGGGRSDNRRTLMRRRPRRTTEPTFIPPPVDPSRPPRPYAPGEIYSAGDRVQHPSFGQGVVTGSPGPGKVEVTFPGGARVLACAKERSSLERPVAAENVPVGDRPPDK